MTIEIPANILGWAAYIILMSLLGIWAYKWRNEKFGMYFVIGVMIFVTILTLVIANLFYGWVKLA